MRTILDVRVGWLVGALGACLLIAAAARADVATERPGSILIFPKVVRDGTRDTVIQITNTGNLSDSAHCFYIDGQLGRNGRASCSETDFFIDLTRQQPTHWRVSTGRKVNPFDSFGSEEAGLDPGNIPPASPGFTGALICLEVGDDQLPSGQNKLKGEATIEQIAGADESKYNAIAIGAIAPDKDNILNLNGGAAGEYSLCPAATRLNFIPDGGRDPIIDALGSGGTCVCSPPDASCFAARACNSNADCGTGTCDNSVNRSRVDTRITVVPCNLDLEDAFFPTMTLKFDDIWDEFEVHHSGPSRDITCWDSFLLRDASTANASTAGALKSSLLPQGALTTQYATARITSVGGPFLAIAESFYQDSVAKTAAAAVNLHMEGVGSSASIRISNPQ